MSEEYADFDVGGYEGCCQIDIIHSFSTGTLGPLKDDIWFNLLMGNTKYFGDGLTGRLLTFAHSSKENKGACTPAAFAKWLRKKGEKVVSVKCKHVTLYICSLSDKFWTKFEDYKKNKEKQELEQYEQRQRGSCAA